MIKNTASKAIQFILTCIILSVVFFLVSCDQQTLDKTPPKTENQAETPLVNNNVNVTVNNQIDTLLPAMQKEAVKAYTTKYTFYKFTDPNENAFTVQVPEGWEVEPTSGLVRPYIDAGVYFHSYSKQDQGFIYISPYRIYSIPTSLLEFSGFKEGSYYGKMKVKKYLEAGDFLKEYVQSQNYFIEAEYLEITDRPDLITSNSSLITKQSAAQISYYVMQNKTKIKYTLIAYTYLMESSGIGIWVANLFGYYSPENLFNETEYLVLKAKDTFKVNPVWAKREAQEVNKRVGIISSTYEGISSSLSSGLEYKSDSMDKINDEWSKTTLGIEEVYNPNTEETYYVGSGSNYYWMDNRNNIYGTETSDNPFPNEDLKLLQIK